MNKRFFVVSVIVGVALAGCGATGPKYKNTKDYSEGLVAVQAKNGKWGYLDERQNWAIPPKFEDARDFKGGRASVKLGGNWGFIDKRGNWK
ncbi:WG repeat-containing protein [Comamonas fluminis]|uniref:WG repeat-containing protein n=1 Tax=Comamonas fluminis TaxID=2796366 RepID=UPI001C4432FD|nr:WG repeat-containing protein [Comamonas fluminis]